MSKFVVLDLDLTLILSTPITLDRIPKVKHDEFIFSCVKYNSMYLLRKRNHFNTFIKHLVEKNVVIIVWSAAEETYIKQIVDIIFLNVPVRYVLTGKHTKESKTTGSKDLNVVKKYVPEFEPHQCLFVDDSVDNNVDNTVSKFYHINAISNFGDDELLKVMNHF